LDHARRQCPGGKGILLAGRRFLRARCVALFRLCAGAGVCAVDGHRVRDRQSAGGYSLWHRRSPGDNRMTTATLRHAGWILRGNPLTAVAAAGVFLLTLIAIFGPWIVPYDPIVSNVSQALMPPSAAHIAGTDQL